MSAPDLHVPFDARVFEREPLRTERLRLRPIEDDDSDDVWQYQRLDEVIRYLPWPKRTRDEAEAHTRRRTGGRVLAAQNESSAALCRRLGMRFEATLREEEYHYGEREDTAVYGILDREWRAAG